MAGPRELLAQPRFRGLYLARVSSQAADGVFLASLVGFVLFNPQDAPGAGAIAGSLAAVLLPFSLVAPFAGIVLDRVDRRRVLVGSALTRAAVLAGLAALMLAGHRGADLLALAVPSRGLVTRRCRTLVENTPHCGHAAAVGSSVTRCTTRVPSAACSTSRTATPSRMVVASPLTRGSS